MMLAAFLFAVGLAPASAMTGNEWRAAIDSNRPGFALGYLRGVVESQGTWWSAAGERTLASKYNYGKLFLPRFCNPDGWTARQGVAIVKL